MSRCHLAAQSSRGDIGSIMTKPTGRPVGRPSKYTEALAARILAGIAGLLAGSFSMALGEWISVRSAREAAEAHRRMETSQHIGKIVLAL